MAKGRKVFDGTVEAARAWAPRTLMLEGRFAADAVRGLPGLGETSEESLADGAVRVMAALINGAPAQETLREAFARGLPISRFELREPHLHDAFLAITGEEAEPL
jgi:ABC-2 type transport system ATP-binding protein